MRKSSLSLSFFCSAIVGCTLTVPRDLLSTPQPSTPAPSVMPSVKIDTTKQSTFAPMVGQTKSPTPNVTPTPQTQFTPSPTPSPTPTPVPVATPQTTWIKIDDNLWGLSNDPVGIPRYYEGRNVFMKYIGISNGRFVAEFTNFAWNDKRAAYPECFADRECACWNLSGAWFQNDNDAFEFAGTRFQTEYRKKENFGGSCWDGGYFGQINQNAFLTATAGERISEGFWELLWDYDAVTRIAKLKHLETPRDYFVPSIVPLLQDGIRNFFPLGTTQALYVHSGDFAYICTYDSNEATPFSMSPKLKDKNIQGAVYEERRKRLYLNMKGYNDFITGVGGFRHNVVYMIVP